MLDREGGLDLKRHLVQLVATGCNEITVNLDMVTDADPGGIETLAGMWLLLPHPDASFLLARPPAALRNRLEAAGLGAWIKAGPAMYFEEAEIFGLIPAGA